MASTLTEQAKRAPFLPGVYFFKDTRGRVIYIGKAANLRNRLRSYFVASADLAPTKRTLLTEAKTIRWKTAANEVEALIEEARLIKARRPKYNVLLRDDKNYFFVGFTQELLPRVFLTHQPQTTTSPLRATSRNPDPVPTPTSVGAPAISRDRAPRASVRKSAHSRVQIPDSHYIGPFTDGGAIKRTLRLLRRIFPYAAHPGFPKRCLEYDLGLCPILPEADERKIPAELKKQYRKNIRAIKDILTGKRQVLLSRLEKEMRHAARADAFEEAARFRDEIQGLERIFAHRSVIAGSEHVLVSSDIPPAIRRHLQSKVPIRIEGYDIANLAYGKAATGSMVVFTNGRSDSPSYRQFRIRSVRGANDVAMIAEVLQRRLRHTEWPLPDLVLIDGGKPQLNATHAVFSDWSKKSGKSAPVIIGLAKRLEELYLPERTTPLRLPKRNPFLQLLIHVRDEAHRFARRYHFRLRDLDRKESGC